MAKKDTKGKKFSGGKPPRSAAQQAAIDKRMKAMRDARFKKGSEASLSSSENPRSPDALAEPVNTAQPVANATPSGEPQILQWKIVYVSDFASIPAVHLAKALHFFDRAVRQAAQNNQCIESFGIDEQGRVVVKSVPLDPLD